MRKKLVLFTILFIFSLFVLNNKTLAVIPTESPSLTIYPSQNNSIDTSSILIELLKIFFALPNFKTTPSDISCSNGLCPSPTLKIVPTNIDLPSINPDLNITNIINKPGQNQGKSGYVYYNQCDPSFGNEPLPHGCTICKMGCGPTTVAMILSSFLDPSYTPIETIKYYQKFFEENKHKFPEPEKNPFYVGCNGSYIHAAKTVLNYLGFKTTKYLVYNLATSDQVIQDFKEYLNNGWQIIAAVNFCKTGCGHFIWVVDVDQNNNIWAYDVWYGKDWPRPFNENLYYPYPKYRSAFGVKYSPNSRSGLQP